MFFKFINDLINQNSEQKSLLDARTKSLENAEKRVIKLSEENKILYEEKKKVQIKKAQLEETLNKIEEETNKHYYAVETLEEKIKSILSSNRKIN